MALACAVVGLVLAGYVTWQGPKELRLLALAVIALSLAIVWPISRLVE
jgi:type IV secretory pathway VirB2 component (pilin)